MIKALAIKELRESLAIVAVALLAMLYLAGSRMGWQVMPWSGGNAYAQSMPFIETGFAGGLMFVSGALAIALGLRQSAWENLGTRYFFLLHRPISRSLIFQIKVAVGLSILIVLSVVPVLVYGCWAATPGNHATPFFWSMTMSAWQACFAMPTIYLASVLSGLRPAKWYGTRLLPLVGAGLLAGIAITLWSNVVWWLGVAILVLLDVTLFSLILAVAEQRDY